MLYIRSTLYMIYMIITAILWGFTGALMWVLPFKPRYGYIKQWAMINLWALEKICGIRYEIEGAENIPQTPCIILAKHQSTWETLALQKIFVPITWVLKRELLRVPFFGWGLAAIEPIAIDRSSGKKAMDQIIEQGLARLKKGRWVVIFPEGTRIAPGKMGKFKTGGARLAVATGYPVLPVAHNAGDYWRRHGFIKYPGTIKVVIGKPIATENKTADEITALTHDFIAEQMQRISPKSAAQSRKNEQSA